MKIQIDSIVELFNSRDFKEIFIFGEDFKKAVSFLDQKIKFPEYKKGIIKLIIKKG